MTSTTPTLEIAKKVLETVDAGLVSGLGVPRPGHMCVEAAVCYAYGLPHGDEPPCVNPLLRTLKIQLNDGDWGSEEERAKGLRRLAIAQLGSQYLDETRFCGHLKNLFFEKILPRMKAMVEQVSQGVENPLVAEILPRVDLGVREVKTLVQLEYCTQVLSHKLPKDSQLYHVNMALMNASVFGERLLKVRVGTFFINSLAYAVKMLAVAEAHIAEKEQRTIEAYRKAYSSSLQAFADGVLEILKEEGTPGCDFLYLCDTI